MSESIYNNASSNSGDSTIAFNRLGAWNRAKMKGPAFLLPLNLYDIPLENVLHIEFLFVGDRMNPQASQHEKPRKNHVAVRVEFFGPLSEGPEWLGARISMDLADAEFSVFDDDETCFPGQLTVKLLRYKNRSFNALHMTSFRMRDTTLGALVGKAIGNRMYQFMFRLYGDMWKGCRDFILQFWGLLVRDGMVHPTDANNHTLTQVIPFVYHVNEPAVASNVEFGLFIHFLHDFNYPVDAAVYI